ncbi:MAG: CRISPR-associated endonuclease Cas1, partial [Puniceicoccales bacterium]|nr:CRISPR-associated endonuclease Cas1 [Puniceicoccales bacterium]
MPTIVLSNPGHILATDTTSFTLRTKKKHLARLPANIVERFIVFDGIEITPNALARIGRLGVPTTFLDHAGRVNASLRSAWCHDALPRLEQARCWLAPDIRLALGRRWVVAKINGCLAQLRRFR